MPRLVRAVVVLLSLGLAQQSAAQPLAYIVGDRNGVNDLVHVVDTTNLTRIATITTGRGSLIAGLGAGIVISPDGSRVYVLNSDDESVSVISTASHLVVAVWPVGTRPSNLVLSPDGGLLYVGNGSSTASPLSLVRVISTASGATVRTIPLGQPLVGSSTGFALSRDGRRLYAGVSGAFCSSGVRVLDTVAGSAIASIPLSTLPMDLALSRDENTVFVAGQSFPCAASASVSVIDTASRTLVRAIGVPEYPGPLALTPGGDRLLVGHFTAPYQVSVINTTSHSVVGTFISPPQLHDMAFSADASRLILVGVSSIALVDAQTYAPLTALQMSFDDGILKAVAVMPAPPAPPTDLFATVSDGSVTLRWKAPQTGVVPSAYVVEGGTTPGGVMASLRTGSAEPVFSVLAPRGVFYIRVHAMAGSVRGPASNEIVVAVDPLLPPATPEGLVGLVNGSSIALAWRTGSAGGNATSIALDVTGSLTTTLSLPPGEAFAFAGVPPGTYTLAVRGVNAFGTSAASNTVTLTFPGPCSGPPSAPDGLRIYKAGPRLDVYWNPAPSGPAPTSYVLHVEGAFTGSLQTTARTLGGTVGPGRYMIRVAAANVCGEGPSSAAQAVTVP